MSKDYGFVLADEIVDWCILPTKLHFALWSGISRESYQYGNSLHWQILEALRPHCFDSTHIQSDEMTEWRRDYLYAGENQREELTRSAHDIVREFRAKQNPPPDDPPIIGDTGLDYFSARTIFGLHPNDDD